MRAAKEKTLIYLVVLIVIRMVYDSLRKQAAEKSPIGPIKKMGDIVPVEKQRSPRKRLGENVARVRLLRRALGTMYFRARYYDQINGEFISQDPLEYVDGMSLYRGYFVPNAIDPAGEHRYTIQEKDKPDKPKNERLPKNPKGCGGWCISGDPDVQVTSCKITKLVPDENNGILCRFATEKRICSTLKDNVDKANKKAKKEKWPRWQQSYCSDGCECDFDNAKNFTNETTVEFKDDVIENSGCKFTVSGIIKIKGSFSIAPCKKKEKEKKCP